MIWIKWNEMNKCMQSQGSKHTKRNVHSLSYTHTHTQIYTKHKHILLKKYCTQWELFLSHTHTHTHTHTPKNLKYVKC